MVCVGAAIEIDVDTVLVLALCSGSGRTKREDLKRAKCSVRTLIWSMSTSTSRRSRPLVCFVPRGRCVHLAVFGIDTRCLHTLDRMVGWSSSDRRGWRDAVILQMSGLFPLGLGESSGRPNCTRYFGRISLNNSRAGRILWSKWIVLRTCLRRVRVSFFGKWLAQVWRASWTVGRDRAHRGSHV
jgi:hypothetical protein